MKLHSCLDVITNSSSTSYISAPDATKLMEKAEEFGFQKLSVQLSRTNFAKTLEIYYYDIRDYLEDRDLSWAVLSEMSEDNAYEFINTAFITGGLVLSYDIDPYDSDVPPMLEECLEIIAVLPDGKEVNISELCRALIRCF